MTFVAFINNFLRRNILVFLLISIAFAFRIWGIRESFPFDYDQAIPAQAAYDFFVDHKLSLVGQELSFPGFYLGPVHNWVQFIPYYFCNLAPDCTPYFYMTISIATITLSFLLLKKAFSTFIAFTFSLIYAVSYTAVSLERGVNSNYFLFITSVIIVYSLHEYFLKKNKYIIIGAFFAGLAVVNFNPIFIFSTLFFYTAAILRGRMNVKYMVISLIAFFLNYLPLAIFDFRHDHILVKNIINFLLQNSAREEFTNRILFLISKIFIPFNTYFLFHSTKFLYEILFLISLVSGVAIILKSKNKFHQSILLWPPLVIIGLVFYKGHIPDYYFQQIVVAILIILAIALVKKPIFTVVFIILVAYVNVNLIVHSNFPINYQLKKKVVNFIITDSTIETFNVYYNMPSGLNTGYSTLFKLYRRQPSENQKNLYIIDYSPEVDFKLSQYPSSFPDKKIVIHKFDSFLRVVSVK